MDATDQTRVGEGIGNCMSACIPAELTEARETIARMAEEVARLKAEIKELKNRPMECDPY